MRAETAAQKAARAEKFLERSEAELVALTSRIRKWRRRVRYYRAAEQRDLAERESRLKAREAACDRHLELEG